MLRILNDEPSLDRTEIHNILGNDRRRAAIEVLSEKVGSVSLRALSEAIAERETNETPPPRNVRESVYNSLHQSHLPKLDRQGVIDYDRDRKTILLGEDAREVYVHMEVVNKYGITWADFYRSLGVLALLTIVAGSIGVPFISELEPLLIATVFLFVYFISTIRQFWNRRWRYVEALINPE